MYIEKQQFRFWLQWQFLFFDFVVVINFNLNNGNHRSTSQSKLCCRNNFIRITFWWVCCFRSNYNTNLVFPVLFYLPQFSFKFIFYSQATSVKEVTGKVHINQEKTKLFNESVKVILITSIRIYFHYFHFYQHMEQSLKIIVSKSLAKIL